MLSSVYCCGYFFRVCLECLAFQTALLFLSRFRSRCFGSSSGFGGGGGGIYSRQLVGYSASADVCGEFDSWHLGWNPVLPESPVQGIPLGPCLVRLHA